MDDAKNTEIKAKLRRLLWKLHGHPDIWAEDEWLGADQAIEETEQEAEIFMEIYRAAQKINTGRAA